MGERLVTVFPRQSPHGEAPANVADYPAADCTVERIGDLLELDVPSLLLGATRQETF
jgi:hypothetical protein